MGNSLLMLSSFLEPPRVSPSLPPPFQDIPGPGAKKLHRKLMRWREENAINIPGRVLENCSQHDCTVWHLRRQPLEWLRFCRPGGGHCSGGGGVAKSISNWVLSEFCWNLWDPSSPPPPPCFDYWGRKLCRAGKFCPPSSNLRKLTSLLECILCLVCEVFFSLLEFHLKWLVCILLDKYCECDWVNNYRWK